MDNKAHGQGLRILLVVGLAVLAVLNAPAQTGTDQSGIKLIYADDWSLVTISDAQGKAISPGPDQVLLPGYSVKTGNTAAELYLDRDRTLIRIAPKTIYRLDSFGAKASSFSLLEGKARILTAKSKKGSLDLTVNTPLASAGVRGTDFVIMASPGSKDWICVQEGTVELTKLASKQSVSVPAGCFVDATQPVLEVKKASGDDIKTRFAGMDLKTAIQD